MNDLEKLNNYKEPEWIRECRERDAECLNERTKRNIEINSNGVWLLNYQPCTKCGGQLMYGGRVDEPKIFCPLCGTRFTEEK